MQGREKGRSRTCSTATGMLLTAKRTNNNPRLKQLSIVSQGTGGNQCAQGCIQKIRGINPVPKRTGRTLHVGFSLCKWENPPKPKKQWGGHPLSTVGAGARGKSNEKDTEKGNPLVSLLSVEEGPMAGGTGINSGFLVSYPGRGGARCPSNPGDAAKHLTRPCS